MNARFDKVSWELGLLARAADARTRGGGLSSHIEAVGTDTRSLPPQSLFVALRGENFDGHAFVSQAMRAGCIAAMVDEAGVETLGDEVGELPLLVVDDTLEGYGHLAGWHRRMVASPVVAVTGSNGKTTTKELIAAGLSPRGPIHKTAGNFNNLVGLPKTLLDWASGAWAAVVELGMNAPGEIERLTHIAAPTVGLITNVAGAHLEGLGSIEGVARAKGELFASLPDNAIGIVNLDDPMVSGICVPLLGTRPRLTFGRAASADIQIRRCHSTSSGTAITLAVESREIEFEVPLYGAHNASNVAAAFASGLALGSSPESLAEGMASVVVPGGRARVVRGDTGSVHVIDDTYNANPASMGAAFTMLADLAGDARRVAALGTMFELGEATEKMHREVGRVAAASGIELVYAAGPQAEAMRLGAEAGGAKAWAFDDVEVLSEALLKELGGGDWLLVKGSRGMRMERVVSAVTQRQGDS